MVAWYDIPVHWGCLRCWDSFLVLVVHVVKLVAAVAVVEASRDAAGWYPHPFLPCEQVAGPVSLPVSEQLLLSRLVGSGERVKIVV